MYLKPKLGKASLVISAGSLWLMMMLGVALLRSQGLVLAFIAISWIVMLVLVIQEIEKQEKAGRQSKRPEPEVTFGKVVVVLLIITLWLMAMLALLAIWPFQGLAYMFAIWAIWVGILVMIVRYLEIKWKTETTNDGEEEQSNHNKVG